METLPADIRRKIAENLKPKDILSLCQTEKAADKEICDNRKFWRLKLIIDYPEIYEPRKDLPLKDPKGIYKRTYYVYKNKLEKAFFEDYEISESPNGPHVYSDAGIYRRELPEVLKNLEKIYEEIVALNSSEMEIRENPQVAAIYEKYYPHETRLHFRLQGVLLGAITKEIERRLVREKLGL